MLHGREASCEADRTTPPLFEVWVVRQSWLAYRGLAGQSLGNTVWVVRCTQRYNMSLLAVTSLTLFKYDWQAVRKRGDGGGGGGFFLAC